MVRSKVTVSIGDALGMSNTSSKVTVSIGDAVDTVCLIQDQRSQSP